MAFDSLLVAIFKAILCVTRVIEDELKIPDSGTSFLAIVFHVHPKRRYQVYDDGRTQCKKAGINERHAHAFYGNSHPFAELTANAE